MNDEIKLLVEWSSPWEEFKTSLRPALARSKEPLAGEAQVGLTPTRNMLLTWLAEALVVAALIYLPAKLASMRPYQPPPIAKYDVIYYSGDELPRIEDAGGAQAGRSGRGGGREAHHRSQTIKVARGNQVREKVVDAPNLKLPHSDAAVANLLAYKPVPGPAPSEGARPLRAAPSLPQFTPVAPSQDANRDRIRSAPSLAANVLAPTPVAPQRDVNAVHLPGQAAVQVAPPPVSAPEQYSNLIPKLTLPAPVVVAPPPTQVTRDVTPLGAGMGAGDIRRQVVPPPAQLASGALGRQNVPGLPGAVTVAPPPAQLSGGAMPRQAGVGLGNATVAPPPPSLTGGGVLGGRGQGTNRGGFGGLGDAGLVSAPPSNRGGSNAGTGVVVSSQPGSAVGIPGNGGTGSLAMSPNGGADPGLGGSGGGTGIGRGNGPGAGFSGEGPGAGKDGVGHGSDPNARGGISPYPGTGGTGSGTNGRPAMPNVSVHGGTNVITLPSFSAGGDPPSAPGRSATGTDRNGPGITVVATSRSGGAFNFYGVLKGDKVYTIYIETTLGTAVMQYADPASAGHPYAENLVAPEPMRADLPAGLPRSRLVVTCILDRSGVLKNPQVLDAGPAVMTSKVLAALNRWKFKPALHGEQPVEVNVILGFNIDTNDRF